MDLEPGCNAHQIIHRRWQEKHRRSEKRVVSEEDTNDTSQQLLKQNDFEKFQEEKRKFEEDRRMLVQSRVELEDERRQFDEDRKMLVQSRVELEDERRKF